MKHNYAYNGITQKEIQFDIVVIDNTEYIVPSTVANALKNYSERLAKECSSHEATKRKYEEINADKYDVIADRIVSALEAGISPNGNIRERLLKHSIDHYEKVEGGEPVFEFRHELRRRIIAALKGFTPEGEPYEKEGVVYYGE